MDWRLTVFLLEVALTFSLLVWLRRAGRGEHPPALFLATLLAAGAVTALLAAVVELNYSLPITGPSGLRHLLFNNVAIALIEELAKYFVAVLLILHSRYLHKISDGILYLIVIGLGFSLVEDGLFLLNPATQAGARLFSFYLHSGTSAIIGYNLGLYHFKQARLGQLILGIAGAVALHLAYNLTTFIPDQALAEYLTFSISLYISLQIFILFRQAVLREIVVERDRRDRHSTRLLNV